VSQTRTRGHARVPEEIRAEVSPAALEQRIELRFGHAGNHERFVDAHARISKITLFWSCHRFDIDATAAFVKLGGMKTALFVILFVVVSIIACVLLPFLAVQYPIVFLVVVVAGVYAFSQTFKQRKKLQ
jgi:hypothetical protein